MSRSLSFSLSRYVATALVVTTLTLVALSTSVQVGEASSAANGTDLTKVEAHVKPLIEVGGDYFKDLNESGTIEPYENLRLPVEDRVRDLLSRMTIKEKVAQMMHPTFISEPDGSPPYHLEYWVENLGIGFILARGFPSARAAANCTNQLQEWAENTRLGVPIVISMDSVHGLSHVNGAMVHPHGLGLAATENVELVRELAEIQRKESLAVGIRETLSPVADVATEPRWGRVQECFGENADMVAEMVRVQVEVFQAGPELNENSVMCTTKHFPGAGPQMEGVDFAPIVTTMESLGYHLKPWKAAIGAGTGAIMPYYSVPINIDNIAALGSKKTLTGLLREELGFEGIICTDWGMVWGIRKAIPYYGEYISYDEALEMGIEAGVDVIGGAAIPRFIDDIVRLVEEGKISESEIDDSVQRILRAKFKLDVFEDPYVDPNLAENIVGCDEHQELSLEAARQSMTLLENDGILPLSESENILVAGRRAGDVSSLTSGWTCEQEGLSIAEGIQERAEEGAQVFYEPEDATIAANLAENCEVAIVVVGEGTYMHTSPWGPETLDLPNSQYEMLEAIRETGTPIVVVVVMGRPYILTWCEENAGAVLIAYYPGIQGAKAIAGVLFGEYDPPGKLPIQIPQSMDQVLAQDEDVPYDIEDPLYNPWPFYVSYEIGPLSISPDKVEVGEDIHITTEVINTGTVFGETTIELRVNGELVDSKGVTLLPGWSKDVTFVLSEDKEGTYSVSLDNQTGSFEVRPGRGNSLMLIIGVIIAAIAAITIWRK